MAEPDETTRLLSSQPLADNERPKPISTELSILFKSTLSITASFALQNIVQAVSIITVGSLGHRELDIASYAYMFATCTGSMVAIGGATALDTLCGHAVASPEVKARPTILGDHLQQSILILSLLFLVVITPIWIVSDRLFLSLGQERWLAEGTGSFLILMIPAGYFQMLAECLKKYAQVQGQSAMVGGAVFAATVLGAIANIILIRMTPLGLKGAPLAFFIYQLAVILLLFALIIRMEYRQKTIQRIQSWKSLARGLWTNAALSFTGLATIATEWWSFEILAMMAARLSTSEIAAQSILMSADLIFTTVSLGIGVAASHRVGYHFGCNNSQMARRAALSPYVLALIVGMAELVLITATRNKFGLLFTDNKEAVETTAKVLPLMALFQVLDLSNGGAGGILRGARKNHLSGLCNFLAYYGVGLTTAWALCFRLEWGIIGLWSGIICGSGALLVLQSLCVVTLKWDKIASETPGHVDEEISQ